MALNIYLEYGRNSRNGHTRYVLDGHLNYLSIPVHSSTRGLVQEALWTPEVKKIGLGRG